MVDFPGIARVSILGGISFKLISNLMFVKYFSRYGVFAVEP